MSCGIGALHTGNLARDLVHMNATIISLPPSVVLWRSLNCMYTLFFTTKATPANFPSVHRQGVDPKAPFKKGASRALKCFKSLKSETKGGRSEGGKRGQRERMLRKKVLKGGLQGLEGRLQVLKGLKGDFKIQEKSFKGLNLRKAFERQKEGLRRA